MSQPADALDRALHLYRERRFQEAYDLLKSIAGITRLPLGHSLLGGLLMELKRPQEALRHLETARKLGLDSEELLLNHAAACNAIGRHDKAIAELDRLVERQPDHAGAWSSLGWTLTRLGRTDEAIGTLHRALAIDPDCHDARLNRGMARLLAGDYADGLDDYEARYMAVQSGVAMPDTFDCPVWYGEPLTGRHILAHVEQGMGDGIQFVRFARDLVARGARVTIGTPQRLVRLFQPFTAIAAVKSASDPGEDFDFTVPLMSLPHRLGYRPDWPAPDAYLSAEPDLVARWGAHLGPQGYKVGVVWQGNPSGSVDQGRSIPLSEFAPLARLEGVRLISLQKGFGLDQMERLGRRLRVEALGEGFDDGPDAFTDSAAVMAHLDLVVTSDTSVAHLAGALGRPTLLLLKHAPDWRWGLSGSTTHWYPSMTLIRQTSPGDWAGVMRRAAEMVAQRRRTPHI